MSGCDTASLKDQLRMPPQLITMAVNWLQRHQTSFICHHYHHTRLTAFFQDNLGKLVPESQKHSGF